MTRTKKLTRAQLRKIITEAVGENQWPKYLKYEDGPLYAIIKVSEKPAPRAYGSSTAMIVSSSPNPELEQGFGDDEYLAEEWLTFMEYVENDILYEIDNAYYEAEEAGSWELPSDLARLEISREEAMNYESN